MSDAHEEYVKLTKDELHAICEQSAEEAITKILPRFGMDPANPFDMQSDFQHLRRWRKATEGATTLAFRTALVILVTGIIGAFWLGLKINMGR